MALKITAPEPAMAAHRVECVVIGAGAIGLSIGRCLARRNREVLLFDKAPAIGTGTSSRNSQVLHSGIYYPRNSFKARFCVRGKEMIYDYCQQRNVGVNRCGKLVVATSEEQLGHIQQLYRQAQENGVTDARLVSKEQASDMEPDIVSLGALYSPSTGIFDSHNFMTSLLADAEQDGATLVLQTEVTDARIDPDGSVSLLAGGTWLTADWVVNAGGLWAHRIARFFHAEGNVVPDRHRPIWRPPRQYFCKGTYFQLKGVKRRPFQHLIYPVPDSRGGLGVHATIDMAGQTKFGPDVEWLDCELSHPDDLDYTPDPDRAAAFYRSIRNYYPPLPENSLVVDYTGIRPKLSHPCLNQSLSFNDFQIVTSKEHGVQGLIHLFGIESPGLTSSMALAEYVCNVLLASDHI